MRKFCEMERNALQTRTELLATLEEAVQAQDPKEDIALFITQDRQVELTHKYKNALDLIDMSHRKK
jgi:hypothetical protein